MFKAAYATKVKLVELVVTKANEAMGLATDINVRAKIFGTTLMAIGPIIRERLKTKATK